MQSPRWLHIASTAFSCCRYSSLFAGTFSLIYKYRSQPVNKQFTVPFSLHRAFKRLMQPFQAFLRLYQYSETFLRTFSTHVHTQSLPRPCDAISIDENWTLTERRVRHLERTVLGRYLLSCHTVQRRFDVGLMSPADFAPTPVRWQSQYFNIIIKMNKNVPRRSATIHFCPQRNQITTTDRSMMHASLWDRCKQILAAKSRSWCTQIGRRICCANKVKIGLWIHE